MGGRTASNLGQATTAMFMVAAITSSTPHHEAYFNWVQLFLLICFVLLFDDGVMEVIVACVSATMHTFPLKLLFFTSFLTQNKFF